MPEAPSTPPAIPDYELLRLVGSGSYGDVWLARSLTGVYRAIKIVWRNRFTEAHPYEREFKGLREFARISLEEPAQLALLHVGRNDSAGFFYYVMELADDIDSGRDINPDNYTPLTLRELRARRGRLPSPELTRLAVDLARALAGLHARGLVHRDIKPANIILVGGTPKLADIGLVTATTSAMTFVGTEGFVPPEGPGTPAADIFSLGKMLYELSTGLDRNDYPRLPSELHRWDDRREFMELNEIIIRACDADTRRRYVDAAAMLEELLLAQAGRSVRRLRLTERGLARARRIAAIVLLIAGVASLGAYIEHQRANRESAGRRAAEAERDLLARKTVYSATLARAQRALELNAHGQARRLLKELIPATGVGDLRGFEWHALWYEAQGDPAEVIREEGPTIERTATSPDGRLLAVHDSSKTVTLYTRAENPAVHPVASRHPSPEGTQSLATGGSDPLLRGVPAGRGVLEQTAAPSYTPLRQFSGVHRFVGFSPDGRWLIGTTPTYALQRWSVADGQPEGPPQSEGINRPLGVLPGGQLVVFTDGKPDGPPHTVRIWDFEKKAEVSRFPAANDGPEWWDFFRSSVSADGRHLALALLTGRSHLGRWRLLVYSLESNILVHDEPIYDRITALALSDDGQKLAAALSNTGEIALLDTTTSEWIWRRPAAGGEIRMLAFSRTAMHLAAAGNDPSIELYDGTNGTPRRAFRGQASGGQCLDWLHSDDTLVSGGSAGDVRQWSFEDEEARREISGLWRPANAGRTIALSLDGAFLALCPDGQKTQILSTNTLRPAAELPGLLKPFGFSEDGSELIGFAADGKLQRWRWRDSTLLNETTIVGSSATLRAPSWAPKARKWAVNDTAGLTHLGEWPGVRTRALGGEGDYMSSVLVAPDGQLVITADATRLRGKIWEAASGTLHASWETLRPITDMCASPDGSLLAVGLENGDIELRTLTTAELVRKLPTGDAIASTLIFSPDGRRLLSGGADSTLHIFDTADWREVATLSARANKPDAGDTKTTLLAMSSDCHTLAAFLTDGRIRVWRTR